MPSVTKEAGVALPEVKGKAEEFWIGVRRGAPFFSDTLAGIRFQQETHINVLDKRGNLQIDDRTGLTKTRSADGCMVRITPEQMRLLADRLAKKAVVTVELPDKVNREGQVVESDRRRGRIVNLDSPSYEHTEGEEPIARFLYLRRRSEMGERDGATVPCLMP